MKTTTERMKILLMSAMVVVAPMAQAQTNAREGSERRTERLERMTEQLGLSAEQVARIKSIDEEHAAERAALRSMEDEAARRAAMKELGRKHHQAVQEVLTSEQRAKADALRAERKVTRRNDAGTTPEQRAEKRTQWMTGQLDLSEQQAADVKELLVRHMAKKEALRTLENEEERKQGMKQVQRSQQDGLKAILTPEQIARWEALKAERKARAGKPE